MIGDEEKIALTQQALERLGIGYRMIRHDPVHTMDDCALVARELDAVMPKNLLLCPRNERAFTLLIMRAQVQFCSSVISRRLNSARLGFASPERLMEKLWAEPGAAGPLGVLLSKDQTLNLALDERLREEKWLAFHPSSNTASLAISGGDFRERLLPALGVPVVWIPVEGGPETC